MTTTTRFTTRPRGGFTIVEVLISIVILAVGLLALATTSIFASTQVRVADLKTEQSLAVQQVVEWMHSTDVGQLASQDSAGGKDIGSFHVWWDVADSGSYVRRVDLYVSGPGYVNGEGWVPATLDTFRVEIADLPVD